MWEASRREVMEYVLSSARPQKNWVVMPEVPFVVMLPPLTLVMLPWRRAQNNEDAWWTMCSSLVCFLFKIHMYMSSDNYLQMCQTMLISIRIHSYVALPKNGACPSHPSLACTSERSYTYLAPQPSFSPGPTCDV